MRKSPKIVVATINFNTADHTRACVESVLAQGPWHRVLVLDNGSDPAHRASLEGSLEGTSAELILSTINLGFAGGANRLIALALADAEVTHVLLLNNDAVLLDGAFEHLCVAASEDALVGARVLKSGAPATGTAMPDSLGIVFYRSLLASNRLDTAEPFFGPTGGFALCSRKVLTGLLDAHGYWFDETYFCYAEDTDLAARALLLGFTPSYIDTPLAIHEGQASSGGGFNDFVLYHGIRNSIWTALKCVPASIAWRSLPFVVLLHAGIVVRHVMRGRGRVVWRLYRDALRGMPAVLKKRARVQRTRRIDARDFAKYMSPRFYDGGYVKDALRDLIGARTP